LESRSISLDSEHDVVVARNEIRKIAMSLGFRMIDQTRLATVTSELARNIVKYAKRGRIIAERIDGQRGIGLRLAFEDSGPGIPDLEAAMRDGFTTGRGLGKGLPGSKRMVDEFVIDSTVGAGTIVRIVKWV
jgi:serine/threonine-protein kinase RsbT